MKIKDSLILIGTSLLLCGCISLPIMPTPKKQQTVYGYDEKVVKEPVAVVSDNKVIVLEKQTSSVSVQYEKTTPKKTFIEKIGSWISGLSMFAFIAIAAGLVLAPTATLGFLVKTIFKWKKAAKETFRAIKMARLEDNQILEGHLKSEQSEKTKTLIGSLKHKI